MLKRLTLLAAVVVAIVVAVQFFTRSRSPPAESPPSVEPPRQQLPAVDPPPPPTPPSAEPAPPEAVASNVPPRGEAASPAGIALGRTSRFMFNCGEGRWFAVGVRDGKARAFSLDDPSVGSVTLVQTEAASGSREAVSDTTSWNEGDVATFEVRGQVYADCVSDPSWSLEVAARGRGATFRGRGNEPSWALEITPQLLVLTATRRMEFAHRAPTVAGARTTYRMFAGTQELVVVIDRMACNDTMSGELFDHAVAVTFEGTTVYGCGRMPR